MLAAIATAGCIDQSPVDPDATVQVHGTVHDTSGAPLPSRPVRMGTGVTDADGAVAVLTVGLSCAGGGCRGEVWDTTTDAEGRFAFEVTGRDTQSSFGEARSTLVSVTASPPEGAVSGATATARFEVRTTRVDLPLLRLVDPGLEIAGGQPVTARWTAAAPGPYELRFEQDDPVPVYRVRTDGTEVDLDARVLEDTSGRVVVAGAATDAIEGSDVALGWRSPGVGYASSIGPPPSRGRGCVMVAADGTIGAPLEGSPDCGLTDGDLVSPVLLPPVCDAAGSSCAAPSSVEIDLGRPVPAELVVVRGCVGGCAIEVRSGDAGWRAVGAAAEGFGAVTLDGAGVDAVRVGIGNDGAIELREVSVWGSLPEAAELTLDPGDGGTLRDRFALGGGGERDRPGLLIAVAGVAAAGVLVGVGVMIGRRRAD